MKKQNETNSKLRLTELFIVFFSLGLTSFGGPIAHLSFFNKELVIKKKWLDASLYSELIALCQFLPGPSSSQVGISIGFLKRGIPGAIMAWLGFTTPSAIIIIIFGYGYITFEDSIPFGFIHGLKVFAVAVVAHAILTMGILFCKDFKSILLAAFSAFCIILWPTPLHQFLIIVSSGLIGIIFFRKNYPVIENATKIHVSVKYGIFILISFIIILCCLPILKVFLNSPILSLADSFFRAGSFVFGGGHVVLPLLQTEIVSSGLVSNEKFLAGYGAAQALPGPLFTFAAYLGTVSNTFPNGIIGGLIALLAIFAPSFFLIFGILPFWNKIRNLLLFQRAIIGINACVVGILIAAFYSPVLTSGILSLHDFVSALFLFLIVKFTKFPIWMVVLLGSIESGIYYSYF